MFDLIYQFYLSFDNIIIFAFLSYTMFILCEPQKHFLSGRWENITSKAWFYVVFSTILYALGRHILVLGIPVLFGRFFLLYTFYFVYNILISIICAHFFLSGILFSKLVYILYFMTCTQLYKMICSPLYKQRTILDTSLYEIIDIVTGILLYILLYLLARLFQQVRLIPLFSLTRFKATLILYFPSSFLLFFGISSDIRFSEDKQIAILAAILLTNLPIIYYFLATIIHSYEEQRRLDDALTQTRAQLSRYRYSLEIQEQVRKERHELKNNYFYIQTLLAEKKYDQLDTYISQVIGEKMGKLTDIQTGNTLIDYLLNRKIQEAQKQHIKTCTEIIIPKNLPVNEEVLCTILLNLMDNAIEASCQENTPDIQIVIKCVQNYLLCRISNKTEHDILAKNPELSTTKKDSYNHGLGIKIIRSAVENQNGVLHFEYEKGYFVASVMLPFSQPI